MSLGHIKRYEVTITGFFGEDAEEDTFRVGSVTNVKLVGGADSEPGDIIKVNAIVGDTSTHEPLRERAKVKSSTVDMPKETGCSEASISTTVAPGGDDYPDLNGVIIGAKASEAEDDPNAAIIPESKREKVELLSDIGKAVIKAMSESLSKIQEGFTVRFLCRIKTIVSYTQLNLRTILRLVSTQRLRDCFLFFPSIFLRVFVGFRHFYRHFHPIFA